MGSAQSSTITNATSEVVNETLQEIVQNAKFRVNLSQATVIQAEGSIYINAPVLQSINVRAYTSQMIKSLSKTSNLQRIGQDILTRSTSSLEGMPILAFSRATNQLSSAVMEAVKVVSNSKSLCSATIQANQLIHFQAGEDVVVTEKLVQEQEVNIVHDCVMDQLQSSTSFQQADSKLQAITESTVSAKWFSNIVAIVALVALMVFVVYFGPTRGASGSTGAAFLVSLVLVVIALFAFWMWPYEIRMHMAPSDADMRDQYRIVPASDKLRKVPYTLDGMSEVALADKKCVGFYINGAEGFSLLYPRSVWPVLVTPKSPVALAKLRHWQFCLGWGETPDRAECPHGDVYICTTSLASFGRIHEIGTDLTMQAYIPLPTLTTFLQQIPSEQRTSFRIKQDATVDASTTPKEWIGPLDEGSPAKWSLDTTHPFQYKLLRWMGYDEGWKEVAKLDGFGFLLDFQDTRIVGLKKRREIQLKK